MKIFFWKKNKQIDTFAHELADQFYSNVQPELAKAYLGQKTPTAKNSKKLKKDGQANIKVKNCLNNAIIQVQQFRELHDLGVYGKARLHLTFRARLVELGYTDHLAHEINHLILVQTP